MSVVSFPVTLPSPVISSALVGLVQRDLVFLKVARRFWHLHSWFEKLSSTCVLGYCPLTSCSVLGKMSPPYLAACCPPSDLTEFWFFSPRVSLLCSSCPDTGEMFWMANLGKWTRGPKVLGDFCSFTWPQSAPATLSAETVITKPLKLLLTNTLQMVVNHKLSGRRNNFSLGFELPGS